MKHYATAEASRPPTIRRRGGDRPCLQLLAATVLFCGAMASDAYAQGRQLAPAQAQPPQEELRTLDGATDSVVVVPGAQYKRGRFVRFLVGSGHRDLWTAPITVPVADLSKIGGGLTAVRLGGGMTTKTLHMNGEDERRYVLRSVDKDAGQGLAEELRGTVYESTLQDQISAFHPFAALVVPPLLDAVGVLHPEPGLYVVPDDDRLGEFGSLMAGMLVIIEERPDEALYDGPGFAGSRKIVNTENFLEDLEKSPKHRFDARRFLAARLVDLIVGDRDKSVNNWLWARFDDGDRYLWQPIPRDRDQALIELDGATKRIMRIYEPRLVRFSNDVPDVVGLTRSAWPMDRPLLVSISRPQWDSIRTSVQSLLSDSVIAAAVRRLPPEHHQEYGPTLAARLKARRDHLDVTAEAFYRIVFEYADIHATDEPDVAIFERMDDGRTAVSIFEQGAEGEAVGEPFFHRMFDPSETREVRLYLHGGSDRVRVVGSALSMITVRISGGNGADAVENTAGGKVLIYDKGDATLVRGGPGTRWIRRHAPRPEPWGEFGPLSPDFGHRWLPKLMFPYSTDLGPLVYAGASRTGYGFLHLPHRNRLNFGFGYAPVKDKYVADVKYSVRNLGPGFHGAVEARYTGIEILHYYGPGNGTEEVLGEEFYRLGRGLFHAAPSLTFPVGSTTEIDVDLRFEVSITDDEPDEPNLVSTTGPYGSGTVLQAGGGVALRFDTRDRATAPSRGVLLRAWASGYPGLLDVTEGAFGRLGGQVAGYWSITAASNQTIALGLGGEKVVGTFPYYESAYLGGPDRLRGFREERFAGDAALHGSAEIRLFVGRLKVLLPLDIGVFGFGDAGRVYVDGESPGGWHRSAGGGIWLAPLYRNFTISATVARSAEGTFLYAGAGFGI